MRYVPSDMPDMFATGYNPETDLAECPNRPFSRDISKKHLRREPLPEYTVESFVSSSIMWRYVVMASLIFSMASSRVSP